MNPNQTLYAEPQSFSAEGKFGAYPPPPVFANQGASSIADEEIFATDATWNGVQPVLVTVSQDIYQRMAGLVDRIRRLALLAPGWDSYGGSRVQPSAVMQAIHLLTTIMSNKVPLPAIVPTSSGGLQLEWHGEEADLELEVHPNGGVGVYLQMPNNQTWEGPLVNSRWRLEAFLQQIAQS